MTKQEGLRLALFEDDPDTWVKLLEAFGHSVLGMARSMNEVDEVIATLGQLKIPIALVDGNLTRGEAGNREGAEVVARIHARFPDVVTVGIPSMGVLSGAQHNFPKQNGPRGLTNFLDEFALKRGR